MKNSTANTGSANSNTLEDMMKLWNDLKETMPNGIDKIDAVLITDDERILPANYVLRTSYMGKEYFILLKKEFEKMLDQFGKYETKNEPPFAGSIGAFMGIPVYEDTKLIREIIISKFANPFKDKYLAPFDPLTS